MKRVKIAFVIVLLLFVFNFVITRWIQNMGTQMIDTAQAIIDSATEEQGPEVIRPQLQQLADQWQRFESLTVTLAGRNHADSVSAALDKSLIYFLFEDGEDLAESLVELISNVRSIQVTEKLMFENLT